MCVCVCEGEGGCDRFWGCRAASVQNFYFISVAAPLCSQSQSY